MSDNDKPKELTLGEKASSVSINTNISVPTTEGTALGLDVQLSIKKGGADTSTVAIGVPSLASSAEAHDASGDQASTKSGREIVKVAKSHSKRSVGRFTQTIAKLPVLYIAERKMDTGPDTDREPLKSGNRRLEAAELWLKNCTTVDRDEITLGIGPELGTVRVIVQSNNGETKAHLAERLKGITPPVKLTSNNPGLKNEVHISVKDDSTNDLGTKDWRKSMKKV